MPNIKNAAFYRLQKIVRGFSNHRRIEIMDLLDRESDLSLGRIAERLSINFKTASEHVRRLALAELITKRNRGAEVLHALTKRGSYILKFLRTLE
ncbi:MAG: winged helix-turn-helix domain-containing protein [Minisyncoccia bacterium]|jgi:Mn-dependent DtxR family transcriptional regulator